MPGSFYKETTDGLVKKKPRKANFRVGRGVNSNRIHDHNNWKEYITSMLVTLMKKVMLFALVEKTS